MLGAAAALGLAACALRGTAGPAEAGPGRAEPGRADAGLALPAGPGRVLLERECLNCHELEALELFKGFYDRERWRSLVTTMRDNGADVDDAEVEVIAEYLARYFGTGP